MIDPTLRQTVMTEALAGLSLQVAYIGVANGLFDALADGGPAGPGELAARTGLDEGYLRRYLDAAFAFEYVEEAADGAFALAARGDAFRPSVAGSLMGFAVQAAVSAHMAERAAGLMRTGERPGERVLVERETVGPLFGPMMEASFGAFFDAEILPGVPVFAEIDAAHGLALDLGCGNGWYLRKLAARYPHLRGLGLDPMEPAVMHARARAAEEGAAERLEFRLGDIHHLALDSPADLIAMNRALHHVWSEKASVFGILRDNLREGGAAVIWEPAWPGDRAALRQPPLRGMAFQNLAEHVQGNHFLRPEEICEAFRSVGMEPSVYRFAGGREAVVVGRR